MDVESEQLAPPTDVVASGKADRIIVNWSGEPDVDGYTVHISEDSNFALGDTGVTGYVVTSSPFSIINDLSVGTQYYIAVSALRDGLRSELSSKVQVSLIGSEAVVTTITPLVATVGKEVVFTITGTDLTPTITVSLQGTDNCQVGTKSSTQVVVTCTPQTAGSQNLYVADKPGGGALEGTPKLIDVAEEDVPDGVITSVSPLEVTVGEDTLFTIVGTNLPLDMVVQLEGNASCLLQGDASSTQQKFLCANIKSSTDTLIMAIGEHFGEELDGSPIDIIVKGFENNAPQNLRVTESDEGDFIFTWESVPGATKYSLLFNNRYFDGDPETDGIIDYGSSDTTTTVSSFASAIGNTYSATVVAFFDGVRGPESEPITFTRTKPIPETTIEPPANVVAVAGDNLIKVTWTDVESADSYNIYVSDQPITEVGVSGVTQYTDNEQPFSITDVIKGSTYYIRMSAVKSTVESELSEEVEVFYTEPAIHIDEDFESFNVGNYIVAGAFGGFSVITQNENQKMLSSETSTSVTARLLPFQDYDSEQRYINLQFDMDIQDELVPYSIAPPGSDETTSELFNILADAAIFYTSIGNTSGTIGSKFITTTIHHKNTEIPELGYRLSIENINSTARNLESVGFPLQFELKYYPSSGNYTISIDQEIVASGISVTLEMPANDVLQISLLFGKVNNVRFIIDNMVLTSEPN